jgi:hypothetical protein
VRFYHNPPAPPVLPGDTRRRFAFLLWPKRIGIETRWLEHATWREEARTESVAIHPGSYKTVVRWAPTRWLSA